MNDYTPSPRSHPRIRPEAAEYARRNQGNMERWFDYSDTSYQSARPNERVTTDEAKQNATTNKGSMKDMLGGYADPVVQRDLHPRAVKSEAADIAASNQGEGMKNLIDNYGNLPQTPPAGAKIRGDEAEMYAERNRGTVNNIVGSNGELGASDQPRRKLGHGAEEIADKHTGGDMGPLLRMENGNSVENIDAGLEEDNDLGVLSPRSESRVGKMHQESDISWDQLPPKSRMRPEGADIYSRQKHGVMDAIMHMETDAPTPRPVITSPQQEETPTPRLQTSPQRTRPEGLEYLERNRGSAMGAIIRMDAETDQPRRQRSNRLMQRSEDW